MPFCTNLPIYCTFGWFLCAVSWFVILPLSVWRFHELWERRQVQLLWARRIVVDGKFVFPVLLILTTVTCPLLFLSAVVGAFGNVNFFRLLNAISVQATVCVLVYKEFVVHCDLAFASLTNDLEWKQLMVTDSQIKQELRQSKYFAWRRTWLHPYRLAWIFGIFQSFGILLTVVMYVLKINVWSAVSAAFILINLMVAIVSWLKTPPLVDRLEIRNEIKYSGVAGFTVFFIWVAVYAIGTTIRGQDFNGSPLDQLLSAGSVWGVGLVSILLLTEFRWRLLAPEMKKWNRATKRIVAAEHKKAQKTVEMIPIEDETPNGTPIGKIHHSTFLSGRHQSLTSSGYDSTRSDSLFDGDFKLRCGDSNDAALIQNRLFAHSDCIALFAEFLISEFSIENLVGFLEFHQFALAMVEKAGETDEPKNMVLYGVVICASAVPMSTINELNHKGNFASVWAHRFALLCDKYVGGSSQFPLNLPYQLTEDMKETYSGLVQRGSEPFDDMGVELELVKEVARQSVATVRECKSLMRDTFSRFRKVKVLYSKFCNAK